jgi:hypothetical protein
MRSANLAAEVINMSLTILLFLIALEVSAAGQELSEQELAKQSQTRSLIS